MSTKVQIMNRASIRKQFPGKAARAAAGQRSEAVRLHCIECAGGTQPMVRACTVKDCFLWPFRNPGKPHIESVTP